MSNIIRRLLQELEGKITEPAGAATASETDDTGPAALGSSSAQFHPIQRSSLQLQPRNQTSVQDEYRRLFQPYRARPIPAFGLAPPPSKRPKKIVGRKLWRHNFVFLRHPHTTLAPDAHERAELMADGLGEQKLEFQEGLGPTHVHEVLCKQHPDIAATAYELCWVSSNRFLEVISSPPRGFTVDFLKTFLNHSKCYVRPIQGSLKSVECSADKENIQIPQTKCNSCDEAFPINKLREHIETCSQDDKHPLAGAQYLDDSSEDEFDEELQEALRVSRSYSRSAATASIKRGECSRSLKPQDLQEVGRTVSRNIIPGKRNLMLIGRDRVLEDTIHYMSKDGFNPAYGITIRFMGEYGIDCGGPLREYFRLLKDSTKIWFVGEQECLLPISSATAIQDRRFIYLGWMISLSLAMNGCPFDYFAPSVYQCLGAESSLENITISTKELPPDKRRLVEKVEATNNKDDLIKIFKDDDHAAFLLYESGSFKKAINAIEDKEMVITELRDGVLYSCWAAIQQLQQGLCNLNALQMIKDNPDIMKNFFCYKAPDLSSKLLSDIFQPQFSSLRALREKEDEAYSYFLDFVDECGSSGSSKAGDIDTTIPLKDILTFATGADRIPPGGLNPSPSLLFYDGILPLASTCSNELTIPTAHTSYYDFCSAFVEGVVGCGSIFGQP